jgi:hypothetical protein
MQSVTEPKEGLSEPPRLEAELEEILVMAGCGKGKGRAGRGLWWFERSKKKILSLYYQNTKCSKKQCQLSAGFLACK